MTPQRRKAKTEAFLRKRGIPILPSLPCIESEKDTELRTAEEIGIRIFCLFCVVGTAFHPSAELYKQYLKRRLLWEHLTPEELAFMSNPTPDRQSLNEFTWRWEALFLLMWTVRLFKVLHFPVRQQKTNEGILDRLPSFKTTSPWSFIRSLELRSKSQILDKSDLLYRLHWATRQAEIDGQPAPGELDPGVVAEWHYAINWVTKYEALDWDDVVTDT